MIRTGDTAGRGAIGRRAAALALCLALGPAGPIAARADGARPDEGPRRVALVIGNADYARAPLENPANDAADVAALLRERLGFETALHLDLDQRGMERAIREFGEAAADADVRLFYYAGHGVSVDGVNYLVPVAADIADQGEVRFEAVDSARVLERMEAGDAGGANVLILDACRDNPLPAATRSSRQGLARMHAPVGSLILYATAPGAVALDGTGRNGTFTKHLLTSLAEPGVHLGDVALDVRVAVMRETDNRQVPWSESSLTRRVYLADPEREGGGPAPAPGPDAPDAVVADAVERVEGTAAPGSPSAPATSDDYAESIVLAYREAAESGDALAQSRLGYLFDHGRLVSEDDARARLWYERAVAGGDLAAHVNLGAMHLSGEGGAGPDPDRARALFEAAAAHDYPPAQANLGMLHQFGVGVAVDYAEARRWFERAAARDEPEAAVSLGDLHAYGLGVPRDPDAARRWYLRAARLGSAAAQSELGYLYDQGEGVEVDHAAALEWFRLAAAQGYPRGIYNLGEMHEYGKGVPGDVDEAIRLYREADRLGDAAAKAALERLGAARRADPGGTVGATTHEELER